MVSTSTDSIIETMDGNCDFCSNNTYEKQGVIENSVARVLYPLRPVIFGNFMVVTKRHVSLFTDLTVCVV